MKICFLIGTPTKNISGGYKIIYEYANRLTQKGHTISIIYCANIGRKSNKRITMVEYIYRKIVSLYEPSWFQLDKKVKKKVFKELKNRTFFEYDEIILCGSEIVLEYYKMNRNKNTVSLIQDYENWNISDIDVEESYKKALINVAISKWLQKKVEDISKRSCYLISNPIDTNIFVRKIEFDKRKETITMLYHNAERKGCIYGLEAIKIIHSKYPYITINLFGYPNRPNDFPNWINYYQKVNADRLREIYNQTTIFVVPSIEEGYGLTGAESMACGCALVTTTTQGSREYADAECALFSSPKDVAAMVENIEKLIKNPLLKESIANRGYWKIQQMSWEVAVNSMERIIQNGREIFKK